MVSAEYRLTLPVAEYPLLLVEDKLGEAPPVQEQLYPEQDLRFPAAILTPRYAPLREASDSFSPLRNPATDVIR
jgi:hypothetical protein